VFLRNTRHCWKKEALCLSCKWKPEKFL